MGGRFRREGTYVCLWLIHVDIWQRSTQCCEALILLLKKKNRIKDPDCIPNFPGSKGKPPVSESSAELVKNRHSLFKIHNIQISVLSSLSNFGV